MCYHLATKQLLILATTWMILKNNLLGEKNPGAKDYILYNSIYLKHPEKASLYNYEAA